jgi:hypothetical protein
VTTFTTLTDATLSQDKPFTQSVARAIRDNPKAMAEGDITAPEVVGTSPMYRAVASNTTALVFLNLPDGYDVLEFEFVNIYPITFSSTLGMEVSTDNGTTWLSTGYLTSYESGAGTFSQWPITGTANTFNTVTNNSINGKTRTYNFSSSSVYKQIDSHLFWFDSGGNLQRWRAIGAQQITAKVTAVRFRFSTGNIAKGYITMRRVRPT